MQDLEEAIARLPERARDVFVLRAIYGYTHEEIGSMLGVTEGSWKYAATPGVLAADRVAAPWLYR